MTDDGDWLTFPTWNTAHCTLCDRTFRVHGVPDLVDAAGRGVRWARDYVLTRLADKMAAHWMACHETHA